ncbi:MAG: hypothetical protein U5R06_02145 [candidate division KSB1 bacterium]|nr:hypothetical protein [candidate division KSB1 bacterium]
MHTESYFANDEKNILDIIKSNLASCQSIAIQAGHFLVYYDHTEDLLLPGIAEELKNPRYEIVKEEIGYFPLLSWKFGLDLIEKINAQNKHVLVLANDWQYIPKNIDRMRFYDKFSSLPNSYNDYLESKQSLNLLKPVMDNNDLETGDFFSEQTLRNEYGRHIKKLVKNKQLPESANIVKNNSGLTCNIINSIGQREEIYCSNKRENCRQEVAELLYQIKKMTGCDTIINIYPKACKEFVHAGTILFGKIFCTKDTVKIINIGCNSIQVEDRADLLKNALVQLYKINI